MNASGLYLTVRKIIKADGIPTGSNYFYSYVQTKRLMCSKPANKKQVLFSKTFLLKKSITNKPAFFIWFAKIYFHFRLLIYFHYSCIINSQKLIKSCYLCNLTRFPFCLFLSDKVIYRVPTFFLHNQTSHCFKSYLSKC